MKHVIKKILRETYEQQMLNDICNRISTGSNGESEKFMENLFNDLLSNDTLSDIHEEIIEINNKWKNDMKVSVNNGRDIPDTLKGSTGDSESDICDMYLSQIQDKVCSKHLERMD